MSDGDAGDEDIDLVGTLVILINGMAEGDRLVVSKVPDFGIHYLVEKMTKKRVRELKEIMRPSLD